MKQNLKLSVYMIVKNEEKRLERTLKALKPLADEIIIIDSGSTDKTAEIAKKYGACFEYHPWENYAAQKSYAESLCHYDWRLSLDADEVLSPRLCQEIQAFKTLEKPPYHVYRLTIADMFPGQTKPAWGTKKFHIERLYHKNYAFMPAHALTADRLSLRPDAKIGAFKAPVLHYSYAGIGHHIAKLNGYMTEVQAKSEREQKNYGTFRLITEFPRQFLVYYLGKRYCLNGFWGFAYAMNLAFARYLKIAKAIERRKMKKI